jgi:hypothetical protein
MHARMFGTTYNSDNRIIYANPLYLYSLHQPSFLTSNSLIQLPKEPF